MLLSKKKPFAVCIILDKGSTQCIFWESHAGIYSSTTNGSTHTSSEITCPFENGLVYGKNKIRGI